MINKEGLMTSKTTKVLAAVLAAVGALAASGGTAMAFPDGQRVLIRNAATEQCVKAAPVPRSTDAPPYQLVLTECEPTDPAQRWYFSWDTLRSDALQGNGDAPGRFRRGVPLGQFRELCFETHVSARSPGPALYPRWPGSPYWVAAWPETSPSY
ncbi:hypothetical protein [Streptomyces sp. ISL-10]|uniref:hypothetical protein n=1 Tax=Streptomyces sp. ISL-10 TaxID=2819172 RepID=UPI0035ABECBC